MTRPPPPALALAAALAQRALTRDAPDPTPVRAAAAGVTAALSVALARAAALQFRRHGTQVEPFHPERTSALVTTGVNAVTRNPMYVGMTGLLLAHALERGCWRALLPVAGFVVLIDRVQVEAEESALLATFGADYVAYREAVPRWLGRRAPHR